MEGDKEDGGDLSWSMNTGEGRGNILQPCPRRRHERAWVDARGYIGQGAVRNANTTLLRR